MTQEERVVQEQPQQEESIPVDTLPEGSDTELTSAVEESPQAINMRNMRESKERAERDRDALLKRVAVIEASQKQKQQSEAPQPEDFSVAPDDIVEGRHLSKYDRKIKELVELRNQGEGLVYTTEQSLEEFGDRLEDEDRELIAERVQDVKDVLENDDVEEIRSAVSNLSEAAHKLAEALYAQAGADYEDDEGR